MITVKKIKNAPSHWVYKQKKKIEIGTVLEHFSHLKISKAFWHEKK